MRILRAHALDKSEPLFYTCLPMPYSASSCRVCAMPISQPRTGRPRVYCSAKCRQRLFHAKRQITDVDRLSRKLDARAWHKVERLESRFGPYDDRPGPEGEPSRRWRVYFYLSRGLKLLTCQDCGRPFAPSYGPRVSLIYCSDSCEGRAYKRRRAAREELYTRHRPLDSAVISRLTQRKPFSICLHCRKPFVRAEKGRPAHYCSTTCRQAAHHKRTHPPVLRRQVCDGCNRPFAVRWPHQKYCSDRCRERVGARRRRDKRYWEYCQFCGVALPRVVKRGYAPKYCSRLCQQRAYRLKTKGVVQRLKYCLECGATLPDAPYRCGAPRRYCSKPCRERATRRSAAAPKPPNR